MNNENSNNYGVTDSPTNRPTLSTSTSSFEALNTHDPHLSRLATKMFQKSSEYVSHELVSSLDDYKLLENMNKVTVSKYSDMKQIADGLATSTDDLKLKFNDLIPLLKQLDDIDETVEKLEVAAYQLDSYSQLLEAKFKSILQKK